MSWRSPGIWSERISDGQQGLYLYQRFSFIVHGGLWAGQRLCEELADQPWGDPQCHLYKQLKSEVRMNSTSYFLVYLSYEFYKPKRKSILLLLFILFFSLSCVQSDWSSSSQGEFRSRRLHAVWILRRPVRSCHLFLCLCRVWLYCYNRSVTEGK